AAPDCGPPPQGLGTVAPPTSRRPAAARAGSLGGGPLLVHECSRRCDGAPQLLQPGPGATRPDQQPGQPGCPHPTHLHPPRHRHAAALPGHCTSRHPGGRLAAAGGPSPDRGSYPTDPTASAPGSLTEAATHSTEEPAGTAAAAGQGAVPVLLQGPPRPTSIPPRHAALKHYSVPWPRCCGCCMAPLPFRELNTVPSTVACYGLGVVDGQSQSGHLQSLLSRACSLER
ncbi:hypothetical protein HaLaN_31408, partial [Haematococcus lacustris]